MPRRGPKGPGRRACEGVREVVNAWLFLDEQGAGGQDHAAAPSQAL
jgi:hypothetical protein